MKMTLKLTANRTRPQTVEILRTGLSGRMASCIVGVALLCLAGSGCTSSTPGAKADGEDNAEEHHHDHGHRPESYTAALAQIKHARDEVKAAFDAGTPTECDDALHEVAKVLDVLPEVAAETDLPKEDWQVVNDQSQHLFDQFMKIHDGFHGDGKQGASFDSVAEEINKAIETLESKVAATGEKTDREARGNHDHEGHEHEHGDKHEGHEPSTTAK
jgi:hypothetical protein